MSKTHIHPNPASDFANEYDWRVMELTDVDAELKALERRLGGATKVREREVEIAEEKWEALMTRLVLAIDRNATDAALSALSETENLAFRARIAAARRAVRHARSLEAQGVDPTTTALLPAPYAQRIERLLGHGEFPVAWLIRLDVLAF